MHLRSLLTSIALAATTLAAPTAEQTAIQGSVYVTNKCGNTVYIWSVDSQTSKVQVLNTGSVYQEVLHYDAVSGGIAIKIGTKNDALYTAAPLLQFAYTNDPDTVYYDLSTVFGVPGEFEGKTFTVNGGDNKDVPAIIWKPGAPSGTKAYKGNTNLFVTLCA